MKLLLTILSISISLMSFSQMPSAAFNFTTINPGNICEGGWTTCANTSTGATNYFWEMPGCEPPLTSTGSTPGFVTYNTPGIYTITLHAINGIDTNSVSLNIEVHEKPVVTVTGVEDLCVDGSMTLGVTPPTTGSWTDIWWDGLSQPTLTVTSAGDYYGSVTDINTCSVNSDTVTIIDGTPTPIITPSGMDLQSSEITGNQWYVDAVIVGGATNQLHTPVVNGTYTVEVTGTNTCVGISPGYVVASVGINEQQAVSTVHSFVNGQLTIIKGNWILYDLTGREHQKGGVGIYTIPEGIYILLTETGSTRIVNIR